ncbi:hypothetical protein WJ542_07325 [Paraburkholderia sp. B3]|uniref:hypothetical protein n=1 Tax=Paraburkholderia sp. B3 TaxID=3134791 RepID=UPI003982505D
MEYRESGLPNNDALAVNIEFQRRLSIWSFFQFQFLHPECESSLYGININFFILVNCSRDQFEDFLGEFNNHIRPINCNIEIVLILPTGAKPIDVPSNIKADLWLSNSPLNLVEANRLLCLATPNMPVGSLTYDPRTALWTFSTPGTLPEEEKNRVKLGFLSIDQPSKQLLFATSLENALPAKVLPVTEQLTLSLSNELSNRPNFMGQLAQRDEDRWREFVRRREICKLDERVIHEPSQLSCLIDAADCSEVQLSELLTIYDCINIIPQRIEIGGGTLKRFGISEADLGELASMNRIRLVLPYSVSHYESRLIQSAFEANSSSIILSRELASRVFEVGQKKDPLLYGPFSAFERISLIKAIIKNVGDHPLSNILRSYAKILGRQYDFFTERGAIACLGVGIGPHVANIVQAIHGQDTHLEMMLAGAHVEWSLALSATYIPSAITEEFSLDAHAAIIASYFGRVSQVPSSPASNRMHKIVSELLAPVEIPALEVAKNFSPHSVAQFRTLARRLMSDGSSPEKLQEAIEQLNADVRLYEKRVQCLKSWGISALLMGTLRDAASAQLHEAAGFGGSVFALWFVERLMEAIPHSLKSELSNIAAIFTGLAFAPSLDAVIVSRSRKMLQNQEQNE